jgi:hypothetical protein
MNFRMLAERPLLHGEALGLTAMVIQERPDCLGMVAPVFSTREQKGEVYSH